jgi:hypothetical protein
MKPTNGVRCSAKAFVFHTHREILSDECCVSINPVLAAEFQEHMVDC